ncbi:deoxyribonuclease IV [Xylanibacillus composti]|uniref:Putative endonuclease 4 n=1 Tax=Xylanibacillus composti TaxID=1572762 RepID=A0A8J4H3Y9_9BACL|nr:deoxyribonuclease IV [Xylanibacillus composti]MDT9724239.1 deoxyribonuclease IV [Xylanibacillus composti]GIQ68243.1 putative endonuclease 4 [Xylanibacillus composti]
MLFGSHVSTRRGYKEAARFAHQLGGRAFQYFPKNPRSLALKLSFDQQDAERCRQYCEEHGIRSIAHSAYPINIAVPDEQRAGMVASLVNDLIIAEACGSLGVVVHFGKFHNKDPLQGYKNSLQCIDEVLDRFEGKALLLLENMAGEGAEKGTAFEEHVHIRQLSRHADRIGFCLDTCHAFASGLWQEDDWAQTFERGKQLGYMQHVAAVHLNDSRYGHGARRDRHAQIGLGAIGEERFRQFLRSAWPEQLPMVLETPVTAERNHRDELELLHAWIT